MKHCNLFILPIFLFAFFAVLISESCGNPDNKKAENTAQQPTTSDGALISTTGTEIVASNTATEPTPVTPKETISSKEGVSPSEKQKTAGTQVAKTQSNEAKPSVEQPKPSPTIPAKQETKQDEVKAASPAPAPAPVVVEKPKEKTQVPAPTDPGKWVVPSKDKSRQNPIKADAESIGLGKSLYTKHCASCHGKKGHGDGSKAAQLDTSCGDFALPAFKNQTDGAIFYKTMQGKGDMPAFKKKLPDEEDVWSIVNYIRTL